MSQCGHALLRDAVPAWPYPPLITAQDAFLMLIKMPLTKPSRSCGQSQELWEGGGKQRNIRLPWPPHFCPSTYNTPQMGCVASSGHQPRHQDRFKIPAVPQASSWHDPFPTAQIGASWQPWREMGETRPSGFLSLKLQFSPSMSFLLLLPSHGPEPITYLL